MDTGRPPPIAVSQEAHAGCLSFELSAKQQRIVVNCGLPATSREELAAGGARDRRAFDRDVQRHLVVPFRRIAAVQRMLHGTPDRRRPARGPGRRARTQPDGIALRASHDGYADRFNVIHQRALMLSPRRQAGSTARTCSCRPRATRSAGRRADEFAVRFHLHPVVKANRLADGHGAMLLLPNKEVWTFNAYEDRVEIEESVYLAGPDGPRRTVQIVIYGRARNVMRCTGASPHRPRRRRRRPAPPREDEPELPL